MAVPTSALRLQADQAALAKATQLVVLDEWGRMPRRGDWEGAWAKLLPRAVARVVLAQRVAAGQGAVSVAAVLAEQGMRVDAPPVDVDGFTGWMQSNLFDDMAVPIPTALATAPVVHAREGKSLAAGADSLSKIVQVAVAGASRQATQAGIVATRGARGAFYESGKCCQRCAVIAGKKMPIGADFHRHPRCDGIIVAVPETGRVPFPAPDPEDVHDLTADQLRAIAAGADMNQVINAKTGLMDRRNGGKSALTANGEETYQTRSRRRDSPKTRLTPKGIYARAGDDREMAIALLKTNGYLL